MSYNPAGISAIGLYDLIAREVRLGGVEAGNLPALGVDLAVAAIGEWQHLRDSERKFGPRYDADPTVVEDWDRTNWELHRDWANDAIELLLRLRPLGAAAIPNLNKLEDCFGRTQARLSVTPAELSRARADARAGRTIPAQVIRDELLARRHA